MANKSDQRAARLAAALRENLKRRKAKSRQYPSQPADQSPEKPPVRRSSPQ